MIDSLHGLRHPKPSIVYVHQIPKYGNGRDAQLSVVGPGINTGVPLNYAQNVV